MLLLIMNQNRTISVWFDEAHKGERMMGAEGLRSSLCLDILTLITRLRCYELLKNG